MAKKSSRPLPTTLEVIGTSEAPLFITGFIGRKEHFRRNLQGKTIVHNGFLYRVIQDRRNSERVLVVERLGEASLEYGTSSKLRLLLG